MISLQTNPPNSLKKKKKSFSNGWASWWELLQSWTDAIADAKKRLKCMARGKTTFLAVTFKLMSEDHETTPLSLWGQKLQFQFFNLGVLYVSLQKNEVLITILTIPTWTHSMSYYLKEKKAIKIIHSIYSWSGVNLIHTTTLKILLETIKCNCSRKLLQ